MASGLREYRRQRGLTLEAIAYLSDGLDIATISRVERGEVKPQKRTVVKLARALGLSVNRTIALLQDGESVERGRESLG
jgi:transcriptional regulator with XRE-family HTH domain